MTRYWSKALFYKEWKTCAWFLIILTVVSIEAPLTDMISDLVLIKRLAAEGMLAGSGMDQWFGSALVDDSSWLRIPLFIIAILVTYQFRDIRREATGDLLASMPFTRCQVIFTKWATGMMVIAVPFLVTYLLLSVFYWLNRDWIATSYWLLPQWALLYFLFLSCFYGFMFFVQTVMGQSGTATVIGAICTVIPWYLLTGIPRLLRELLGLSYMGVIEELGWYTVWPRWIEARMEYLPPDWTAYHYIYTHFGLKVLTMAAVIVVFYWLAERAYAHNPLERNGQLLMFRFLEPVLVWGFAICSGMLIAIILGLGYSFGRLGVALCLAAGTAFGYWMARRVVLYYQR